MSMINRQVFNIRGMLPGRCTICGAVCGGGKAVCGRCREAVRGQFQMMVCPVCGGTAYAGFCFSCSGRSQFIGLLPYIPWGQPLVRAFKFGGRVDIADLIAGWIADFLKRPGVDLISWVPLHPSRKRRRGYDQAGRIAARLAAIWKIPARGLLTRIRRTGPQARCSARRRRTNVRGAFRASAGRGRVLLVDDVLTTGATMGACGEALEEAGWELAGGVALFYG